MVNGKNKKKAIGMQVTFILGVKPQKYFFLTKYDVMENYIYMR